MAVDKGYGSGKPLSAAESRNRRRKAAGLSIRPELTGRMPDKKPGTINKAKPRPNGIDELRSRGKGTPPTGTKSAYLTGERPTGERPGERVTIKPKNPPKRAMPKNPPKRAR